MNKISEIDLKRFYELHYPKLVTFLEYYKAYVMYSMERASELMKKEETKWMSALSSPTMFVIVSTVYSMYLDSETAFSVYKVIKRYRKGYTDGVDEADVQEKIEMAKAKDQAQDLEHQQNVDMMLDILDNIYNQEGIDEQMDRIALDAILLGTGFGMVTMEIKKETYNIRTLDEKTQTYKKIKQTLSKKIPGLSYISPMELIPFDSGGYKGLEGCRAVMRRRVMAKSKVVETYTTGAWNFTIPRDQCLDNGIIDRNDWEMKVRYMLFNNLPDISSGYFNSITGRSATTGVVSGGFFGDDIITNNTFRFGENENSTATGASAADNGTDPLMEVFEIYYGNRMQLFVNSKDCGLQPMIGPWNRSPIFGVNFKRGLNSIYGMGAGHIALPLHKVQTAFLNLRIDIARLNAQKPMAVASDEIIFEGEDYMPLAPNKLVKLHDPDKGIKPLYPDLSGGEVANSEVDRTGKMIQEAFGLSGYSMGIQQKVERAAKNVTELVKSSERGQKEFVKSRGRAMAFVSKYWILLAREMDDDSLMKICGTTKLKEMDIEDIMNEYNFTFNMTPNQSAVSEATMQITNQIIKDRSTITRADGTLLLDAEAGFRATLENAGLDMDLILTQEEAQAQLEAKLKRDADIEVYKRKLAEENGLNKTAPEQPATGPSADGQLPEQPEEGLMPVAGVQGGSSIPGEYRQTNPEGIN